MPILTIMSLVRTFVFILFLRCILMHGDSKKHYVIYMGDHIHPTSESVIRANHELLASVTGSLDGAKEAAVHHYSKSFQGFSAMITPEQAQELAGNDSVVSVFESRMVKLQTTNSWDFMGLNLRVQKKLMPMNSNSDIIVGVLDSGVWPESSSFSDKGMGPVPKKFKGECVTGDNFTLDNCNRKIIGARYYTKGFEAEFGHLEKAGETFFRSARDSEGHGSHTASTIAGSVVGNASLLGMGRGTSRGGAPNARLAIYKIGWFGYASDADILAAFDNAINDGVDIISISFAYSSPEPVYFENSIAIGGFHAFRSGILVSAAAGNEFWPGTVSNVAPWILTVAASSVNRDFSSDIFLGNSKVLKGFSLNPTQMKEYYGLITGNNAAAPGVSPTNARLCENNTLDESLIKGKIVVCSSDDEGSIQQSMVVKQGGGVGIILINPLEANVVSGFVIPGTFIDQETAAELQAYMKTEKSPTARIHPTEAVFNARPAPQVAAFSSAGPNVLTPDIIKPDVTGPGVNILAAWSPVGTIAGQALDYNIDSGTSMSCPHISGVAAVLKSQRPYWSPSSIKSAMMTTATVSDKSNDQIRRDPNGTRATPFDYGAGHINPIAALNPGLVYDFDAQDVIEFLCSVGASPAQLKNLTAKLVRCPNHPTPSYNFNYPSIGISNMTGPLSVIRAVTYVSNEPTVYTASIDHPDGVRVTVMPSELKFKEEGEKMNFRVNFVPLKSSKGSFVFGSLTWTNGVHSVRSPIAVKVLSV